MDFFPASLQGEKSIPGCKYDKCHLDANKHKILNLMFMEKPLYANHCVHSFVWCLHFTGEEMETEVDKFAKTTQPGKGRAGFQTPAFLSMDCLP